VAVLGAPIRSTTINPILRQAGELDEDRERPLLHDQAAHPVWPALRPWAQSQYRSDEVVREILETVDLVTLTAVADELGGMGVATPGLPAGRSRAC
jgi:hypothetical protein